MLTSEDLAQLEVALLPARERHHLRLLAHGLRTLQAIAATTANPQRLPNRRQIEAWAAHQAPLADDPGFQEAFLEQLSRLVDSLEAIAAPAGQAPLDLGIPQLVAWATEQADGRIKGPTAPQEPEGSGPPPG